MINRTIDITDDNRGILGRNHIVGHAYIDDKNGEITFTDDSRGLLGNKIIGHGYYDKPSRPATGGSEGGMGIAGVVVVILVILSAYVSWRELLTDFWEFPLEGLMFIGVAVLTFFAALFTDFMTGVSVAAIIGGIAVIIDSWHGMGGVFGKLVLIVMGPIIMAGFGLIPAAIGSIVRFFVGIHDK